MKKFITTFLIIIAPFSMVFAQRNPNTNADKINKNKKGDTIQNNQIQNQHIKDSIDNNIENKGQIGAYLNYGTSTYSSAELQNGIGFGFKLGFDLLGENLPISLFTGLGFDYLYFGGKNTNQSNDVTISINSNAYGWYPYVDLELGSSWPVTIFGTAYLGGRFFFTRQNINYTDANNQSKTDTKNIEGDVTLIYGLGGGLKIKLEEGLKLELRYQQNHGNESKIIDPSTIQFDSFGNLKTYQNKRIDTDLEMLFIGLILCF
jgi:opacity protein-like surface antigen